MARAATGTLMWDDTRKIWRGRVTLIDGSRPWFDIPNFPHNKRGEKLARELVTERAAIAKAEKLTSADFAIAARKKPEAPPDPNGTVSKWFETYFEWKEKRPVGGESVDDERGRFSKWV